MDERTFVFNDGTEVGIRKISQFMLARLIVDTAGNLPIPMQLIKMGRSQDEKLIPFYESPTFKNIYDNQQARDQQETMSNIAIFAIIDDVPNVDVDYYKGIAIATKGEEYATPSFIKSLWLMDKLDSQEDFQRFQEAILGTGVATDQALETAQEKFPVNS